VAMATGGDKPPSLDDDIDIVMTDAAPATSSAAACTTRFAPRAKGKPVLKPKPKPKPEPKAEPEPKSEPVTEAIPAPPKEDGDDAMDVDVAGKGAGPDEEEEEDFVVREIDVYFTPKPFDDDGKVTPPLPIVRARFFRVDIVDLGGIYSSILRLPAPLGMGFPQVIA
jgi:DNA-directed RNA polymerase III subunit RPC5